MLLGISHADVDLSLNLAPGAAKNRNENFKFHRSVFIDIERSENPGLPSFENHAVRAAERALDEFLLLVNPNCQESPHMGDLGQWNELPAIQDIVQQVNCHKRVLMIILNHIIIIWLLYMSKSRLQDICKTCIVVKALI
ncbi:MAG: hypothetical protein LBT40_00085 [Deltaproteobacteria bacterium]|jgi:hypothetical protein|nr:hypothetical protein [Deltaproteobacteria bacterium]